MQQRKGTCGPSSDAAATCKPDDRDSTSRERSGSARQDQEAPDVSNGVAGSDGKLQAAASNKPCAADAAAGCRDHQLPRDVVSPAAAAAAAAGQSAFAAQAGSFSDFGTSAGSDQAGSFMRPRGVEAMMGGGQRRTASGALTSPSGALTSPSGLSDHGSLLTERAASSGSAHRALLGRVSPDAARAAAAGAAATTSALLELPDATAPGSDSGDGRVGACTPDLAPSGDGVRQQPQQQQQQQQLLQRDTHSSATAAGGAAAGTSAPAAAAGAAAAGPARGRPADLLIPSPAASYFVPMESPATGVVHAYAGGPIPIDELDLDVIDGTPSVDACGLSTSSSPTISGAPVGRSTPGGHMRSSRDHDLRRVAALNQMMSPSMQQGPAHVTATTGTNNSSAGGGPVISIFPEGGQPQMFTGPTRNRALAGSSNSLASAGSGAEQFSSTEPSSDAAAQYLQSMRLQSPAHSGSPARPRSATGPPRAPSAGASRASSAAGSPVPPASHGPAAALLAGSVVASPRTPHSPLSAILSPRTSSARMMGGQGTPLPGPLFGSGFNVASATGPSPGTSPGTSSVAAPSSTASSCCTGSSASAAPAGQPPAAAGGRSSSMLSAAGAANRRLTSPSPTAGLAGGAQQQQQQQLGEAGQPPTQMQQHLRQQLQLHDTRLGPHGGSPLSPSHHHQQLPPRGDALLSPSCPTPLVPPALTPAGSQHRQPADGVAAGVMPGAPGTTPVGRSAGGVGHLRIHEWLDHQSWRLPYEVPQGLRDAADVREAAAQEQQLHTQSRMGPSRGPGSSRASSQRNSLSNLDSPGSALLFSGSHSHGLAGRFPAAAGALAGAGMPPPALHSLHQQPQASLTSSQHHQHLHQQQQHQGPGERSLGLLAAIQSQVGAAHAGQGTHLAGPGVGFDGDLSVGASGPVSTAHLPAHTVLAYLPAGSPAGSLPAGAAPYPGLDGQQHQQLHLPAAATASAAGGGHSSSSGGGAHRVGWSPLGPLGQYPWSFQGAPRQLPLTPRAAGQQGMPGSEAGEGPWCDREAQIHSPHGASRPAAGTGVSPVWAAQHSGAQAGGDSSGGPTAVQLGAGSHLCPACSPGRPGGSSCCCQRHGDCTCSVAGAAAWPGAREGLHRSPAVQHSPSSGVAAAACGAGADGLAGGPLCAALDVREYQQSAAPPTWRQLQSPLVSPSWRRAGADAVADADADRQHLPSDQHVLPGIAQLLQRRGEDHHRQQQEHRQQHPHSDQQHHHRLLQQHRGASRPAPVPDADGSSSCGAVGLPWASGFSTGLASAADAHPTAMAAAGCRGDQGRGVGAPAGAAAGRCSSDGCSEGSPAKRSRTAAAAQCNAGGTSGGGGAATLAELLWDKGFVGRVVRTLPGVDPQSQLVWETVAELQQALLTQDTGSAQQPKQPQ